MPLTVAIEPDRRQAAKVAAIGRQHLLADIIVAESTDHAFGALAGRVPDLILTSMLLSPRDESTLADRLRDLDDAGTHVQTLVIPVLASGTGSPAKSGGLFGRLRRSKAKSAVPDGCEPSVFAAQISEYLERAASERALTAADDDADRPLSFVAAPVREQASRFEHQDPQQSVENDNEPMPAESSPEAHDEEPPLDQPFGTEPSPVSAAGWSERPAVDEPRYEESPQDGDHTFGSGFSSDASSAEAAPRSSAEIFARLEPFDGAHAFHPAPSADASPVDTLPDAGTELFAPFVPSDGAHDAALAYIKHAPFSEPVATELTEPPDALRLAAERIAAEASLWTTRGADADLVKPDGSRARQAQEVSLEEGWEEIVLEVEAVPNLAPSPQIVPSAVGDSGTSTSVVLKASPIDLNQFVRELEAAEPEAAVDVTVVQEPPTVEIDTRALDESMETFFRSAGLPDALPTPSAPPARIERRFEAESIATRKEAATPAASSIFGFNALERVGVSPELRADASSPRRPEAGESTSSSWSEPEPPKRQKPRIFDWLRNARRTEAEPEPNPEVGKSVPVPEAVLADFEAALAPEPRVPEPVETGTSGAIEAPALAEAAVSQAEAAAIEAVTAEEAPGTTPEAVPAVDTMRPPALLDPVTVDSLVSATAPPGVLPAANEPLPNVSSEAEHAAASTLEPDEAPGAGTETQGHAAAPPAVAPEWVELLTSLKQDIAQLRAERTESAADATRSTPPEPVAPAPATTIAQPNPPADPVEPVVQAAPARVVREIIIKKKRSKPRTGQKEIKKKVDQPVISDEWGFFNPETCGFASLISKLDEVTRNDKGRTKRT